MNYKEPIIRNVDDLMGKKKAVSKKRNAPYLPDNPLMCLVISRTGGGKTNVVLEMILQGILPFDELIVYSKTLDQPKLAFLRANIQEAEKKGKRRIGTFVDNENDLPSPESLDPKKKKLVLFDDVLEENQDKKMSKYYTRGRHVGCNVVFAAQSFFNIKKSAIRTNANYLMLFKNIPKGDIQNLSRLYCPDISVKEFERFYYSGTKKDHSFVTVDLEKNVDNGCYKHGFTKIFNPRCM